jgi:Holliday junction resolvase
MYHQGKSMTSTDRRLPRERGKEFERTVARRLTEKLGVQFERALGASRDGGSDVVLRPGQGPHVYARDGRWVIECKRTSKRTLGVWWRQAADQANRFQTPVLVYQVGVRKPRHWVFAKVDLPMLVVCKAIEFYATKSGELCVLDERDAIAHLINASAID